MATRATHVDKSVNERRLRPIYDCLDNGNNKKALQEAEKLLKKQRDFQCAKALKALAMLRLGKREESWSVLREIHAEVPVDDATLQAMTICYRELHKPELIADIYEAAVKKDPQNEEFMTHLFMAYVRLGNYKKQQQIAMNLYKIKPKNPYYFWAVMSIVMQAYKADEKLASSMLLPLAQRMTEKFVNENKLEAEAEIQLYLMILDLQGNYEEALSVMNGPLGEKLTSYLDYQAQKKAEIIMKLQRWPEANSTYKKLINKNPDQWFFYDRYFETAFKLIDDNCQPSNDSSVEVDYTVRKVVEFILHQVTLEDLKGTKACRGPYLAKIELLKRLEERQDPLSTAVGQAEDLIMSYFEKFGDRSCFYSDMCNYAFMIQSKESCKVFDQLKNQFFDAEGNLRPVTTISEVQRQQSYVQLCRFLGHHDELLKEEKLALSKVLIMQYNNTLHFGENLLSTDLQPSDNYCLLAAYLLIDIWRESSSESSSIETVAEYQRDNKLLWQPIILLECALKFSPSNYQMKLLLIKLYNLLGAVGPSYTLYESLNIKHILQDCLGYFITSHLCSKAHFSQARTMFGSTLKFFTASFNDTVDNIISSYKYGSFTKIPEFVKCRERLNNSLQYGIVHAEKMIVEIILEANNSQASDQIISNMDLDPEKEKIWENIRDNRDLSVLTTWSPSKRQLTKELISKSFKEELDWMQCRNLIIRCIAAANDLISSSNGEEKGNSDVNITNGEKQDGDTLQDLVRQLKELNENFANYIKMPLKTNSSLEGPEPSRLLPYLKGHHLDVVLLLNEVILYLYSLSDQAKGEKENLLYEDIMKNKIINLLEESVSEQTKLIVSDNLDSPVRWADILENFSNLVETLSLAALLCDFCHRTLKPAKSALIRKGKKKKATPAFPVPQAFDNFNFMVEGLEKLANTVLCNLNDSQIFLLVMSLTSISLNPPIFLNEEKEEFVVREVKNAVEKSYHQSIQELKDVVQNKAKYFASLKL